MCSGWCWVDQIPKNLLASSVSEENNTHKNSSTFLCIQSIDHYSVGLGGGEGWECRVRIQPFSLASQDRHPIKTWANRHFPGPARVSDLGKWLTSRWVLVDTNIPLNPSASCLGTRKPGSRLELWDLPASERYKERFPSSSLISSLQSYMRACLKKAQFSCEVSDKVSRDTAVDYWGARILFEGY